MKNYSQRIQPKLALVAGAVWPSMRAANAMSGLIPLLILISVSANAATFEDRVNKATAAFETEQGETYDRKLVPYIQRAIQKCASVNSASGDSIGKFVLVADVTPDGKVLDPVVKPETNASICLNREFSAQILPAPPISLISDGFAPLVVEIYVVP